MPITYLDEEPVSTNTNKITYLDEPVKPKGIQAVADKVVNYVMPQGLTDAQFGQGEHNLLGDVVERPAEMTRAAIQSNPNLAYFGPLAGLAGLINKQSRNDTITGATTGNQSILQTNLDNLIRNNPSMLEHPNSPQNLLKALGTIITGKAGDFVTNPLQVLTMLAPYAPVGGGQNLGQLASQEIGKAGNLVSNVAGKVVDSPIGQVTSKGISNVINMPKNTVAGIKNTGDKLLRGGLNKTEAARIEEQYGSSNGSLVEIIKTKLNQVLSSADEQYSKVFRQTPDNKFINIKSAVDEAGNRLKRLGLITDSGKLTQLGESEIARDSTYGKLLDFYRSADAISGIENLANKQSLTQNQMIKLMKSRNETMVNKEQFLFLRDKLNSLYKNKPSDIDVNRVVNKFYQSGEDSGLKGLQVARKMEREAFRLEKKYFNKNTGDLKIATETKLNRIGTSKPLSKQEMEHIAELQRHIKHDIIGDARKINRLNRSKELIQKTKERALWGGAGALTGGYITKKLIGR